MDLTPFTMVQITFTSNKILDAYLNGDTKVFLFMRLTLISLICSTLPRPLTIGGHLLQGVGHTKFYSCSGTTLNYSTRGGPSLQMSIPVHTVVLRLRNSPNLRICSRLGSRGVSMPTYCNFGGFLLYAALSSINSKIT